MRERQLSHDEVMSAVDEIREFLNDDVLAVFEEATGDPDLWPRAATLSRDFLARRGIALPERLEVDFVRDIAKLDLGVPGRHCLRFCRSVDPTPPPPDPSGIVICVELCLPWVV